MTITQFRYLIALYVILLIAGGTASAFGLEDVSRELTAAYAKEPSIWTGEHFWFSAAVLTLLSVVSIASLVGFFLFKRWGRTLSLYLTIASPLICLFSGTTLSSPLENMFFEAATLLWTALLTLAYCSPLNARFAASSSPMRGASASR